MSISHLTSESQPAPPTRQGRKIHKQLELLVGSQPASGDGQGQSAAAGCVYGIVTRSFVGKQLGSDWAAGSSREIIKPYGQMCPKATRNSRPLSGCSSG